MTSFRSLPLMLRVNGQRGRQEFGQAQSKKGAGGNLTKTPASAVAVPKADGEWEPQPGWSRNGAGWRWVSCKSWQSPGSSAKKSLYLYWLCGSAYQKCGCPFSLGIMTRWSSSNMCMIFLVFPARKNKALEKCAWL